MDLNIKFRLFLDRFEVWALKQPDILGVAIVGSFARGQARNDSDLDLIVITAEPKGYLLRTDWVDNFGKVNEIRQEDFGLVQVVRVFYEGGLEVEFGITTAQWLTVPMDAGTERVLKDGYKVCIDKQSLFASAAKTM